MALKLTPPVTVRNSVRPLPGTRSEFETQRRISLGAEADTHVELHKDERNIITIFPAADSLHSPPLETNSITGRVSTFRPTALHYYAPPLQQRRPSKSEFRPRPPVVKYLPEAPEETPDQPSDRVDVSGLSWVGSLSSALPSLLNSLVLPALAAGSAVWINNNLPTPVEHQRRRREAVHQEPDAGRY